MVDGAADVAETTYTPFWTWTPRRCMSLKGIDHCVKMIELISELRVVRALYKARHRWMLRTAHVRVSSCRPG